MFKVCKNCCVSKPLDAFGKRASSKDGRYYYCKECNYDRTKKWIEQNPEKKREQSAKWKQKNSEKVKNSNARYYENNKNIVLKRNQKWKQENPNMVSEAGKSLYLKNREKVLINQKEYRKNNRSKLNAKAAKERAARIQATPIWLTQIDREFIEVSYAMAKIMSETTGDKYHVDHIYPLQGKEVCGLHVPLNLQVLLRQENLSKGNRLVKE